MRVSRVPRQVVRNGLCACSEAVPDGYPAACFLVPHDVRQSSTGQLVQLVQRNEDTSSSRTHGVQSCKFNKKIACLCACQAWRRAAADHTRQTRLHVLAPGTPVTQTLGCVTVFTSAR